MSDFVTDIAQLESLYGTPGEASLVKVAREMTPCYRAWIMAARLCIVTTVGPEGTDASPRGDSGPVVREMDPQTLALPDWRGNNRIDSLRNIVADDAGVGGRVSLMFMVPGSNNVVRVNGRARVSVTPKLLASFEQSGANPRSVILVRIGEIYSQCARALIRAETWAERDAPADLPSVGDMLREMTHGQIDGGEYDAVWGARAAKTMW